MQELVSFAKGQIINISGFEVCKVSVATAQVSCFSVKAE
jgi:hypothetical protein